ncbi:MAG TPA: L,D-transpeptidase family protein [Flavobacterium sp.]|nr:L,D-transpeptidase family protein [Flavobacterium sp.]
MRYLYLIIISVLFAACNQSEDLEKEVVKVEPETLPEIKITQKTLQWTTQDVITFYKEQQNNTLWNSKNKRGELLDALIVAKENGLNPESYPITKLFNYQLGYNQLNAKQRADADVLYTQTFLNLAKHLAEGRINPKKFYGDWEAYQKKINYQELLLSVISDETIEDALKQITPKNDYYKGLKNAYATYRQLMKKDTIRPIKSSEKTKIAYQLALLGDYTSDQEEISSEKLTEAVKQFQKRNNLTPTGKIDETTLKTLNIPIEDLTKKILVNLERARWISDDLGEKYVLVNIPEARLFLFDEGKIIDEHIVIVGKPERRTPVLSSQFSQFVINPTWTVPPTILKNDLTPNASRDSTYFSRNNMIIYNNKGEEVSPADWDAEQSKLYRYVQQPGASNSLGQIKFDFPNNHMVYLHDTNSKGLFTRKNRALSSGCVRVQNPFDLADHILKLENNSKTKDDLLELVAKEKTKFLPLKKQVSVHQMYWTAWQDQNGQMQFRPDVYDFDHGLYEKISN